MLAIVQALCYPRENQGGKMLNERIEKLLSNFPKEVVSEIVLALEEYLEEKLLRHYDKVGHYAREIVDDRLGRHVRLFHSED